MACSPDSRAGWLRGEGFQGLALHCFSSGARTLGCWSTFQTPVERGKEEEREREPDRKEEVMSIKVLVMPTLAKTLCLFSSSLV